MTILTSRPRPKYYVPRNPIQTPAYYPQVPNPILSSPGIFSQLDVETLFYVFYYHPGTYQQYVHTRVLFSGTRADHADTDTSRRRSSNASHGGST